MGAFFGLAAFFGAGFLAGEAFLAILGVDGFLVTVLVGVFTGGLLSDFCALLVLDLLSGASYLTAGALLGVAFLADLGVVVTLGVAGFLAALLGVAALFGVARFGVGAFLVDLGVAAARLGVADLLGVALLGLLAGVLAGEGPVTISTVGDSTFLAVDYRGVLLGVGLLGVLDVFLFELLGVFLAFGVALLGVYFLELAFFPDSSMLSLTGESITTSSSTSGTGTASSETSFTSSSSGSSRFFLTD